MSQSNLEKKSFFLHGKKSLKKTSAKVADSTLTTKRFTTAKKNVKILRVIFAFEKIVFSYNYV